MAEGEDLVLNTTSIHLHVYWHQLLPMNIDLL